MKPIKYFTCEICHEKYSSGGNLSRHKRDQHGFEIDRTFRCGGTGCSFSAVSISQLKRHNTMAHSNKKVKCQTCAFICRSESGLKKHVIDIHGFHCSECVARFSTQKKLNAHMLIHTCPANLNE